MLELTLLGGFDARLTPDTSLVLPTRKTRALLAYLALHPDKVLSRESLAGVLWSERGDRQAHNSLSQAVTALRKGLGEATPDYLLIDNDSLTLKGCHVRVDVTEFEHLAAMDGTADLEHAAGLYRGELLAGLVVPDPAFDEWLVFERGRLETLAVGVLTRLLAGHEARDAPERAIVVAQQLLKFDPFQEAAHRALIRAYARQGQLGLALRQYDQCAEILRRELDVGPEAETTRLRNRVIRQRSVSPAIVAGDGETATIEPNRERDKLSGKAIPDDETDRSGAVPAAGRCSAVSIAPQRFDRRSRMLLSLVLLLAVVAGLSWIPAWRDGEAPVLPDRPSLAVLPFANFSDDPAQNYFVDGITEDLITDLAKIPALFVISRNSTVAYEDRSVTVREVAEELGVRYVLAGSVRRRGEQVRINVQLVEARRGEHLWAERFDASLDGVFTLQDRITARIVEALALQLVPEEAPHLGRRGTDDVAAYDAYLLGLANYHRGSPEDNARAAANFERAIRLDPGYARAHAALAKVYARAVTGEQAYADRLGIYWTEGYARVRQLMARSAEQPDADYHVLRSWLALKKHLHEQAIVEAEQALALAPNDAGALEALAESLIFAGRPKEGIEFARRAMRQNPTQLGHPFYLLGLAEFALGRPQATVQQVRRAMNLAPEHAADFAGLLAAAHGELGALGQARAAFERFSEGLLNRPALAWTARSDPFANPRYHTWQRIDLAWSVFRFPFADRAVLSRLAAGFDAAGASGSVGGYLPLVREHRLNGPEIRELLFGREIGGSDFWLSESTWRQRRGVDGRVEHSGYALHAGMPETVTGTGWIRDDALCEQWLIAAGAVDICTAVFRIPESRARLRWGDYVMVTDIGPAPFSVFE